MSSDIPDATFVEELLRSAMRVVLERAETSTVQHKSGPTDPVTDADLSAEQAIVSRIRERYPHDAILAEEGGGDGGTRGRVWVIDPLDGTLNFVTRVPLYGTAIAFCVDGEPLVAGISCIPRGEILLAVRGHGVSLDGRRVHCSTTPTLKDSSGVTGAFHTRGLDPRAAKVFTLSEEYVLSAFGSSAISAFLVATGRRDWELSKNTRPWDRVPHILALQESGCRVTTLDGAPAHAFDTRPYLAANPTLHARLLATLNAN